MVGPNRLLGDDNLKLSIQGDQTPQSFINGDLPPRYAYNNITGEVEAEYTHKSDSLVEDEEEDDSSPDISCHPTQGDRSVTGSGPNAVSRKGLRQGARLQAGL